MTNILTGIATDIETTGLDQFLLDEERWSQMSPYWKNKRKNDLGKRHGLFQIGAVDLAKPEDRFQGQCYIGDDICFDRYTTKIHGFRARELRKRNGMMSEKELLSEFFAWLSGREDITMTGQNARFDHGFISAAAAYTGERFPMGYRVDDNHSVNRQVMSIFGWEPELYQGRSDLWLDKACILVGIPRRGDGEVHDALYDALLAAECRARSAGIQLLPEFEQYALPDYLKALNELKGRFERPDLHIPRDR